MTTKEILEEAAGQSSGGVVLELRSVSKRFGMVQAVASVSLKLHAGQVVGLVGDNGAGKSTLVGMISGVLKPDSGEILVDGRAVTFEGPSQARDVGIETVFQNLSLIPTLDITENIFLNRELYYENRLTRAFRFMDRRRMRDEVREVYESLGLDLPDPRTKVAALSGGQRQAVAISRAVKWGSHIVLLDEPAAALGVKQTEIVLSLIERLRQHGIAVIFISHNMDHVLRVADRAVVMRLGRKVADRPIAEVTATDLVHLITSAEVNGGSKA